PALGQLPRVGVGVVGALVARVDDDEADLGAPGRPAGQGTPAGDLGVVGVGVDGEDARGGLGEQRHGASSMARRATSRAASSMPAWVTNRTVRGPRVTAPTPRSASAA